MFNYTRGRACKLTSYVRVFFFSSRRRHTRLQGDWSSDVCSSDLWKTNTALCPIGRSNTRPASPISTTPMRSPRNSMQFGIDRLLEDRALRKPLAGRRVALLAHPASVTRDLVHSLDALAALGDLDLVAAFGPQHGLRGDKQDNMIESPDFTDPGP